MDASRFADITLDELDRVEIVFRTNVVVYRLEESDGKPVAELVRHSLCHYHDTLNVNL